MGLSRRRRFIQSRIRHTRAPAFARVSSAARRRAPLDANARARGRARARATRRGVAAPSRARIRRRALVDVEPAGGALERRRARRRDVRRVRDRVRARDGVRGRGPGRDGARGDWDRSHRLGAAGRVLLARRPGVDPGDDRVRVLSLAQRQIF